MRAYVGARSLRLCSACHSSPIAAKRSTVVAEARRAEADEQLANALAFYRSVGATRYVVEGEALLAASP